MLVAPALIPTLTYSVNSKMESGITRGPPVLIHPRKNILTETTFISRCDRLDRQIPRIDVNAMVCISQAKAMSMRVGTLSTRNKTATGLVNPERADYEANFPPLQGNNPDPSPPASDNENDQPELVGDDGNPSMLQRQALIIQQLDLD